MLNETLQIQKFKVGRREKLAQKPWRKEIYPPVPPRPLHKSRFAITVGYNRPPWKRVEAAKPSRISKSLTVKPDVLLMGTFQTSAGTLVFWLTV